MKQLLFSILFICSTLAAFSQEEDTPKRLSKEEEPGHFKRENVFIGGGVALGFSSNIFGNNLQLGITPEIGYSFNQWLDLGVSLNLNYVTFNFADRGGGSTKQRSFNYGGGVFLRAYPLQQFFIQAQPEYNFIATTLTNSFSNNINRINQKASSFLVGVGYGSRNVGQSGFYTTILFDLGKDNSSPYRQVATDGNGFSTGTTIAVPVIRAGYTFYLRPKKQK